MISSGNIIEWWKELGGSPEPLHCTLCGGNEFIIVIVFILILFTTEQLLGLLSVLLCLHNGHLLQAKTTSAFKLPFIFKSFCLQSI